ncbi:ATP-dependent helicase [Anaeromyxobacter oryzae]|uniref:DNA 3'-5' helicase n=1 Tax=Anaeromyxobacter oryzae TaxID=2918170 RepID=A0ABM7WVV1_9BACT|nr:UvrD-helicase domain-containing protein [Anaeromyxobacter oryzae]BDG03620.1 DNA helicase [Anaeromyxobacter oryzae]
MSEDLLQDLNDAQREAVLHGDGPLLVLAGAGSGKTRVIVHRIARLVRDEGVIPWQILAVTFTNKAAGEMRERLEALLGLAAQELWVQTFHAFGARFLRREAARAGLPPSFAIYDTDDQVRLVKRLFAEMGVEDGSPLTAREALSRIDRWKNAALRPAEVEVSSYDVEGQLARQLYERYQAALLRAGAADFGDLIVMPTRLLEEDAALRARWAGRFRHVLVDEFQDTNPAQYRLMKALAGARRNVCVVGDDDQAIYRWRGADVSNILGFDQDFPGTRVVKLEQNYRSTRTILDAAHAVISRAKRRREKRLWTDRDAGAALALLVGEDEHAEAERIARGVAAERGRGTPGDEIAVLYRTNAQSRPLEAALRAARIPYVIVRGTSFYERAEVKDAAAYLRLALNPASDIDLERVVNRPARKIGEKTVERLRAHATAKGIPLYEAIADRDAVAELKPAARAALGEFHDIVASLHADVPALDAGIAVQEALKRSGLLARLEEDHSDEAVERAENLAELVAAAREFDEALLGEAPPTDPDDVRPPPLARFLEQIALLGEADAETPEGRVALMTLHAAKGLEFEAVFLAGLEDGTLPYERPWSDQTPVERDEALDEERRLCYVGMTRAKARLTLSLARRRMGYGEGGPSYRQMEPSRFLRDLPPELFGEAVAREVRAREARAAAPPLARPPVVRRHPGALEGEPHIELDGDDGIGPARPSTPGPRGGPSARGERISGEPTVEYDLDQRPSRGGAPFQRGARVRHASLGEGIVLSCEGAGMEAKATVRFDSGDRRVVCRFLVADE